jgi:hypothetical protein
MSATRIGSSPQVVTALDGTRPTEIRAQTRRSRYDERCIDERKHSRFAIATANSGWQVMEKRRAKTKPSVKVD